MIKKWLNFSHVNEVFTFNDETKDSLHESICCWPDRPIKFNIVFIAEILIWIYQAMFAESVDGLMNFLRLTLRGKRRTDNETGRNSSTKYETNQATSHICLINNFFCHPPGRFAGRNSCCRVATFWYALIIRPVDVTIYYWHVMWATGRHGFDETLKSWRDRERQWLEEQNQETVKGQKVGPSGRKMMLIWMAGNLVETSTWQIDGLIAQYLGLAWLRRCLSTRQTRLFELAIVDEGRWPSLWSRCCRLVYRLIAAPSFFYLTRFTSDSLSVVDITEKCK